MAVFPTLTDRSTIHVSDRFTIQASAREADGHNDDVALTEVVKHVEGLWAMVRDTPGKIRINIFMDVDNRAELSSLEKSLKKDMHDLFGGGPFTTDTGVSSHQ